MANFVAIDGPPRPTMAAMDSPLCHKWSPINILCADLLQIPSTDLRHSVYVLPRRLTGYWLEATP